MERFSKNKNWLAITVLALVLFGAIRYGASSFESRQLTAQAIQALNASDATKKRISDLTEKQRRLSERLDTIRLTSTPGVRDGQTYAPFSELKVVPPFESAENVIQINAYPDKPLSFVELSGLSAPFSFKGGTYPGMGGTCTPTIDKNCTVVLEFKPNGAGNSDTFRQDIQLRYKVNNTEEVSNTLIIRGRTERSDFKNILASQVSVPSAFVGESADFNVWIHQQTGENFHIKSAVIVGSAAPYSVVTNGCSGVQHAACVITMRFSPTNSGLITREVTVGVDIGTGAPLQLPLTLSSQALAQGNTIDPARHVLIVYNADWAESVETKNYYLANRPRFSEVNVLGIHFPIAPSCPSLECLSSVLEVVSYQDIKNKVVTPVTDWLLNRPEKDIQYIVLMRGLPTRPPGPDTATPPYVSGDPVESVQSIIRKAVGAAISKELFVTSLDLGSFEATKAYINKLKTVYASMPTPSPIISARGTPFGGDNYYFNDSVSLGGGSISVQTFVDSLKMANPSAQIFYKKFAEPVLTTASNVTALEHGGIYRYGWNAHYATDNTIRLSGRSSWWLGQTLESFNGLWLAAGHQGNFIQWFSANAYGGTNYQNTPVAAVTHVIEPRGLGNDHTLFACWDAGRPFVYCAWKSDQTGGRIQAVGDPLVTR